LKKATNQAVKKVFLHTKARN